MAEKIRCKVCDWEEATDRKVDSTDVEGWAAEIGCHRTTITRHIGHAENAVEIAALAAVTVHEAKAPLEESGITAGGETYFSINRNYAVTLKDWEEWVRHGGGDPDDFVPSIRSIAYGVGMYSNRLGMIPKHRGLSNGAPKWPVIEPATPVTIRPSKPVQTVPRVAGLKLALKCADHQIGFRALPDGSYEPFHDAEVMALFVEVCRLYQPDKIQILGDFLDLPSQSRWAQEAAFARTTQMSLQVAHNWLAELRAACPNAEIVIIEGNHDKRLQTHIETNSLSTFGLTRAKSGEMPEEWPVMSLPFLLRLEELDVRYIDAYPAATDWDNDDTRNIHGTRANSKGSTTSQYIHETPNLNTWAGHTHRAEITYHRAIGPRGEAIDSYSANPGCMCRTDGAVPSVHGAIGADGSSAKIVENWQNALGMLYYNETEGWPQVHLIKNGSVLIGDTLVSTPFLRAVDAAA